MSIGSVIRRFLLTLGWAVVIVCLMLVLVVFGSYRWWTYPGPSKLPKTVVIMRGGSGSIAHQLALAGLIDHEPLFAVVAKLCGQADGFQAGEYLFQANLSPAGIADVLDAGKVVIHKLTIPEGFTTAQALSAIADGDALAGKITKIPTEGALLPGTYFYVWGDNRQTLTDRMTREMTQTLTVLWRSRAPGLPLERPQDAVTLASIVEKETALAAERPLIASVFYNRMRRGMRLQSDPTVIYALTDGQRALGRALTHADMLVDSPYNTYVAAGLPPGPIANPGKAALLAVLHPAASDALYFVASGTGGHAFAATLKDHDRDIAKWRQRVTVKKH